MRSLVSLRWEQLSEKLLAMGNFQYSSTLVARWEQITELLLVFHLDHKKDDKALYGFRDAVLTFYRKLVEEQNVVDKFMAQRQKRMGRKRIFTSSTDAELAGIAHFMALSDIPQAFLNKMPSWGRDVQGLVRCGAFDHISFKQVYLEDQWARLVTSFIKQRKRGEGESWYKRWDYGIGIGEHEFPIEAFVRAGAQNGVKKWERALLFYLDLDRSMASVRLNGAMMLISMTDVRVDAAAPTAHHRRAVSEFGHYANLLLGSMSECVKNEKSCSSRQGRKGRK
eukprot:g19055.t1